MSKKTLLSEAQVRQFMKYANMGGLTDSFVNEMYGGKKGDESKSKRDYMEEGEDMREKDMREEDLDEGRDKKEDLDLEEGRHKDVDEDAHKMEEGAHNPMEEEDMMEGEHVEAEVDIDEPEGDLKQALDADVDQEVEDMVAGLVSAIAAAIEDETGVDIAVDADGGEEVEMDMDADMGDMDMDMDMDVEMPGDEGPEDEVEVDMVAEVTKRVMARIEEAKAAKKLQESRAAKIDQVADRILERIMNKK